MASVEAVGGIKALKISPYPGLRTFTEAVVGGMMQEINTSDKPIVECPVFLDGLVGQQFSYERGLSSGEATVTGVTVVPSESVVLEGELEGLADFTLSARQRNSRLAVACSLQPRLDKGLRNVVSNTAKLARVTDLRGILGIAVPIFNAKQFSLLGPYIEPHSFESVAVGTQGLQYTIRNGNIGKAPR